MGLSRSGADDGQTSREQRNNAFRRLERANSRSSMRALDETRLRLGSLLDRIQTTFRERTGRR